MKSAGKRRAASMVIQSEKKTPTVQLDAAPLISNTAAGKNTPQLAPVTYEEAKTGNCRTVRVYADGIFDMFHYGHARALRQAKNVFPKVTLVVGICNDELTFQMKGYTVMTASERYECARHCRYVDEVITDAPWVITPDFLHKHQIDFVAHDDIPYQTRDCDDVYEFVKKQGKFVVTQRTEGISTSDLIVRIIRDYDKYVRRSLLRGYSRKEMNVGFFKDKELRLSARIQSLRKKSASIFNRWELASREFLNGFLRLFGSFEPTVGNLLRRGTARARDALRIAISTAEEESESEDLSYDDSDRSLRPASD